MPTAKAENTAFRPIRMSLDHPRAKCGKINSPQIFCWTVSTGPNHWRPYLTTLVCLVTSHRFTFEEALIIRRTKSKGQQTGYWWKFHKSWSMLQPDKRSLGHPNYLNVQYKISAFSTSKVSKQTSFTLSEALNKGSMKLNDHNCVVILKKWEYL